MCMGITCNVAGVFDKCKLELTHLVFGFINSAGEQYTEIKSAIPTSGTLTNYPKIAGVYDKGSVSLGCIMCRKAVLAQRTVPVLNAGCSGANGC